jgi:hypothetical protein
MAVAPPTTLTCLTAQGARRSGDLASWLTPARRERVLDDTLRWIKQLRLVPIDGVTMRQRFQYRHESLWWFTELFLHKERQLESALVTIAALDAAQAAESPARIEIATANRAVRDAARAFAEARHIPIAVTGQSAARPDRWASYLIGVTTLASRLRPASRAARRRIPRARLAAFVHTAFWRQDGGAGAESYVGPILDALDARIEPGDLTCVGVGPRRNFRARRWWDPVMRSPRVAPALVPIEQLAPSERLVGAMDLWRHRDTLADDITHGPGIRAAALVEGCDLWEVLRVELARAARLQWPWSARAMDEAGAALDAIEPDAAVTYAEAGGWGRALVLEARRRGIATVGIQHGFIYRHWLNYRHEPDELERDGADSGFPFPDRTLVFDRYAAEYLESAGHMPARTLRITGSAKLDQLAGAVARFRQAGEAAALRAELGMAPDAAVLVLAAKFVEIRDELPALFAAVQSLPGVHLIVKPHPAETAAVYRPLVADASRIAIAEPGTDLARLLAAGDAVVTKNSTVAIDALVLELPAVVIGLPNNLSPFVDAGVMIGAEPARLAEALHAVLYDQQARDERRARAAAFVGRYEMQPDGRAALRAADEILACVAGRTPASGPRPLRPPISVPEVTG